MLTHVTKLSGDEPPGQGSSIVDTRSTLTKTGGAGCACALFVKVKLNSYSVSWTRSAARVTVRLPALCQSAATLFIADCELVKVRLPDDVLLPTSPVSVTMGLLAMPVADTRQVDSSGTLGLSCTVITLLPQGHGLLWLAVATVHTSGVIMRGDFVSQLPELVLLSPAVM